jgi:hypothetical protein
VALRHALGAGELTRTLANDALQLLVRLSAAASG